jgi:RNA polymerase sigma factor (sigma-70 family)
MLSREQKLEMAKRIETTELAYWRTLLEYPLAYRRVALAASTQSLDIELDLDACLRELSSEVSRPARFRECVERVARQVREADVDRRLLKATREALQPRKSATDDAMSPHFESAREYYRLVDSAWRTQQIAKNDLMAAHQGLVAGVARRYRRQLGQAEFEDLIQEGNLGLIKAIERYDYSRGNCFSTYAIWWVRDAIRRAITDKHRVVRVPMHVLQARAAVERIKRELMNDGAPGLSAHQLGTAAGLSPAKFELTELVLAAPLSLESPVRGAEGRRFLDELEDPNRLDPVEQLSIAGWLERLPELLDVLSPMECQILRWRFGLADTAPLKLQDIAMRYGYSRERVRQLESRALTKIRGQVEKRYGVSAQPGEC